MARKNNDNCQSISFEVDETRTRSKTPCPFGAVGSDGGPANVGSVLCCGCPYQVYCNFGRQFVTCKHPKEIEEEQLTAPTGEEE